MAMRDAPRLLVTRPLLSRLQELPRRPWEVGGWLLGYWSADRATLVVTHGTPPATRGTALGITISGRGHYWRFDEAWTRSGGHITFVGDWHTHPGGPAIPSRTDVRAMRQLAEDPNYCTPEPLIAIVSIPRIKRAGDVDVAFYLRHADGEVIELPPTPFLDLPPQARSVPDWPWPRRRTGPAAAEITGTIRSPYLIAS